jgi:hypothetical protein
MGQPLQLRPLELQIQAVAVAVVELLEVKLKGLLVVPE